MTKWYVVDVMPKGDEPNDPWAALLIDLDPEVFAQGHCPAQSRWLDLGRHRSRDDACELAEQLLATKH